MKYRLGLCQVKGGCAKKEDSIARADVLVRDAAACGAKVIALPEMWNCPYENKYFFEYGEDENGMTVRAMSDWAKEFGVYLVGGSIPELDGDKVYNTSFVFDKEGKIIAKHRKVHLFDICIKGGLRVFESDTFSSGDKVTYFDSEYGRIGVAVCYDIRFPELFRKMCLAGCNLIIVPAAFNMTTGPAHWEMSIRMRAVDNQLYIAGAAPARDGEAFYRAYGNSCVADPWGVLIAKTNELPGIVIADIDTEHTELIRSQLPILMHRRPEVYGAADTEK